jgi:hypothetical protein
MGSAESVDPPAPGQPRATEYFAEVSALNAEVQAEVGFFTYVEESDLSGFY